MFCSRWVRAAWIIQDTQHSSCPGLGSGPAAEASPRPTDQAHVTRVPSGALPVAVRGTLGPAPAPPNQGPRGGHVGRVSRAALRHRDAPPQESSQPMGGRLTKLLCPTAESRALIGRGAGGVSGHAAPGAIASWRDGGERGGHGSGRTLGPSLPPHGPAGRGWLMRTAGGSET